MTQPKLVDLNLVLSDLNSMLRRIIGEDIELTISLANHLWTTLIDPGQVEQILVNLAVNARDAMPDGGKITIETRNVALDDTYAHYHPSVLPGEYVMLAVSDTGTGIEKSMQKRIFEPFFTTKVHGKGTGLGLATCYGIVKQNNGSIWVYSEPGKGSVFKVYLPRMESGEQPHHMPDSVPAQKQASTGTILLVEDEASVRTTSRRILESAGYTVREAVNGADALAAVDDLGATAIDLVVTDVVMPVLGGKELSEQLKERNPELKVLFISGYTDSAIIDGNMLDRGVAFLQKPFSLQNLLRAVRNLLASP